MASRIEVVPYDPSWSRSFEIESASIMQALEENCIAIHHVGSTAVPGLWAKPKVDIILVVKDKLIIDPNLEKIGYEYRGEFNIPFHRGFEKRNPHLKVNLHVYEEGNPEIELNLLFRDYLRNHPETLQEYADLKRELVGYESSHKRDNNGFSGYNLGKDVFIKKVLSQAGFEGLCMRFCTHYDEWEAANIFRQKYFLDKGISIDSHRDTGPIHLIFYRGTKIIGYAHIQPWEDQKEDLLILLMDEVLKDQGIAEHFLTLCKLWLKQKGVINKNIQVDFVTI